MDNVDDGVWTRAARLGDDARRTSVGTTEQRPQINRRVFFTAAW